MPSAPPPAAGPDSFPVTTHARVARAGRLVATVRDQATRLLAACATIEVQDVAIADRRLAGNIMTAVGAVEIAAHGWDVAEACGAHRPIPPALATGILDLVPPEVTDSIQAAR